MFGYTIQFILLGDAFVYIYYMKTKLEQFIKRNKKRNSHLYDNLLIEGIDYIICPVSNERLSMIKSSYIEKILLMSVTEYDWLYPKVRGVSEKRKSNIKTGLKQIDSYTGLTKYQLSQVKSQEILKIVGSDGLSGYDRKGQRTRATHMCKIDEFGRNGYSRLATKAIIKGNKTKAAHGLISLDRNEFKRYKLIVTYLTEKYRKELTDGYITGLAGKQDAWHIDHMYSILKGYQHKISPLVIGNRNNLRMIPWKENIKKHSSCSITLDELFCSVDYTHIQSESEFTKFTHLINEDITHEVPPNGAFLLERFYESNLCS